MEACIKPSRQLSWVKGLKPAYAALGATQRDQYSWVAATPDTYVFSAEADHINPEDNVYDHRSGIFEKRVSPMSRELGNASLSISHSKELFNAVHTAYVNELKCHVLVVKGTKFGTTKGGIKAASDGHLWKVTEFSGTVEEGYSLKLIRVE